MEAVGRARVLVDMLPHLVPFRIALIMCWASAELERDPTEEKEAYFSASLPVYQQLLHECNYGCDAE